MTEPQGDPERVTCFCILDRMDEVENQQARLTACQQRREHLSEKHSNTNDREDQVE